MRTLRRWDWCRSEDVSGCRGRQAGQGMARRKYRVAIKSLSDERQEAYRQIKANEREPEDIDLAKPTVLDAAHNRTRGRWQGNAFPDFEYHLLCGEDGAFPGEFNALGERGSERRDAAAGVLGWYRNPPLQPGFARHRLQRREEVKIVRPDFIFFATWTVDCRRYRRPSRHPIRRCYAKISGFSTYAEKHAEVYRRIDVVAQARR